MTPNRILSTLFALTALGTTPTLALDHELKEFKLWHQGVQRTYYVYDAATMYNRYERPPVVFSIHGGGGSAQHTFSTSNWAEIADQEHLIVIYPEGTDGNWNDGRGVDTATGNDVSGIDDVGFFRKMFDRAANQHGGDPERLFVTGASNGGTMSYRLAIELGHRLAGAAAVIANMPEPLSQMRPRAKLPILIMNGTDDPLMTWEGGTGDSGGVLLGTLETLDWWVQNNRGAARPRISSTMLPDVDTRDGSTVELSVVNRLDAPVVLYTVHGGGHSPPGGDNPLPKRLVGNTNQDIDANTEILAFFLSSSR